ncbi:MAG: tripartite tricarboxylate transporter substrate binding protein [Pseudomonadota bacterium]
MKIRTSFNRIALATAVTLLAAATGQAYAADPYPTKPIRVIVPFPAGGSTDVIGRAVAQRLSDAIGQSVVVENIGGASTMIGAERVARSAADGYTLLIASSTTFATNPHLFKKMSYSIDDFVGVSMIAKSPLVLAVGPALPVKNLAEFTAYAKARPGQVSYGTTGRGGMSHLTGEMVSNVLGIKMLDIPYRGSAPALTDVMGGQLPLHVDSAATSLPLYKSGKIKVLAITSEKRASAAPDVPTFIEAGYPKMVAYTLIGLFAPAKTPKDVVDKLNAAMKKALASEELLARLSPDATVAQWTTPEQTIDMFKSDRDRYGVMIKAMNIAME